MCSINCWYKLKTAKERTLPTLADLIVKRDDVVASIRYAQCYTWIS